MYKYTRFEAARSVKGEGLMDKCELANKYSLFLSGDDTGAQGWLGLHIENGEYIFRVFAPAADGVFLVGSFNSWQESHPMTEILDGVFEARVSCGGINVGDLYKFKIMNGGNALYRSDPFGFAMDVPPHCASVVADAVAYKWRDKGWMAQRSESFIGGIASQPLNIYELHLGSWIRQSGKDILSYSSIADELAPYVKQMGYTHVELLPVAAHPYFGSWGYLTGGYFAPDSRFGEPWELQKFVDTMHRAGIGVILDMTFAHFPKDEFGLYEFDGTHLYEYEQAERRETGEWGSARFDLSKGHAVSFLTSNALYWIENYHIDGIRLDAVSSMLYLDYGKAPGEWQESERGDNICLEAVEFFKKLNAAVKAKYPDVMMIAEESSGFKRVTGEDGLGFDFKWNMGWMNDTLRYANTDFRSRGESHKLLNFPLTYAFDDNSVLPISHDEVVHGKKSFLDKMPGDYWQKFAGARAFEALRMTSPGKKLTFMGCEIGQFCEWNHEKELDWFLLDYEAHYRHQLYMADLNNFYLANPALWQRDGGWDGFKWIDADDEERSIISFRRIADNGCELIIAINFTPQTYSDYILPVPEDGIYEEVFNSDDKRYGGSGVTNTGAKFFSRPNPLISSGRPAEEILPFAVRLRLPPLGVTVLKLTERRFASDEDETPDEKPIKKRRGIRKLPPPGKKIYL